MSRRPSRDAPTAFARSARFWLRAYPMRWQALYGEEVATSLAELAPAGARRLAPTAALALVRSGWATRWRGRPDLGSWMLYRLFDLPIRDCDDWVADDIDGRWYPVRHLALAWLVAAAMLWLGLADPVDRSLPQLLGPVLLGTAPVAGRLSRRRARRWHLLDQPPRPDV